MSRRKKYRYLEYDGTNKGVADATEAAAVLVSTAPTKEIDELIALISELQDQRAPQNRAERRHLKTKLRLYRQKSFAVERKIIKSLN